MNILGSGLVGIIWLLLGVVMVSISVTDSELDTDSLFCFLMLCMLVIYLAIKGIRLKGRK